MKKFLAFAVASVMMASTLPIVSSAAVAPGETTYTNKLASQSDLADWDAYYAAAAGSSEKEDLSKHWTFSNSGVSRVNDIVDAATSNIAILTFTGATFTNFDMTITYQKTGTGWPWAVVAFRQTFPGKYFLDDGCGVFIQDEGQATNWGGPGVGGPHEGPKDGTYKKDAENKLNIKLVGGNMTVSINGKQVQNYTFSDATFNSTDGYISLEAVDNNITFKDFSITKLDTNGNPIPIVEKTTTPSNNNTTSPSKTTNNNTTQTPASSTAGAVSSGASTSEATIDLSPSTHTASDTSSEVSLNDLENGNSGGAPVGLIIGIIAAGVGLAGGGVALFLFLRRKKQNPAA